MNILISQRHRVNQYGDREDSLENNYVLYFEKFGFNLFPVPNAGSRLDSIVGAFKPDGVILTGGGDVDPALYGADGSSIFSISKERDMCEAWLINMAIQKDIPVLGICRGMQFINVFFGGKLLADIKGIDIAGKHGTPGTHDVRITDGRLCEKLGRDRFRVNSYHNRGVLPEGLGKGLKAFAMYEDIGLVEACYHMEYPVAGIQWHPERAGAATQLDEVVMEDFIGRKLFWRSRK